MKISLDAGALCTKGRFGTFTFTENIINALAKFDKINEYFLYSFCDKPDVLNLKQNFYYKKLRPKSLWLSARVSIEEMLSVKNIFLALNQAIPIVTMGNIISFSHGLSFYFYPNYYPDSYFALKDQLDPMVKRSKNIIVSSKKVKSELQKIFPNYKYFEVINYGIPLDMVDYEESKRKNYFLYVGMSHPIKNINFLIKAFKEFKKDKRFKIFQLFLVGLFKDLEDKENKIFTYQTKNRADLKKLYSEATGYLTSSFYESFNFPVLEALAQKCKVIGLSSAIIPELKKYVSVVNTQEEFVAKMKELALGNVKLITDLKMLNQTFSWVKYIRHLKKLY